MAIQKKFLPFIIAGLAALVAMFLINIYIQQQVNDARKRDLVRQEDLVTVVVAKQDIAQGVTLAENLLSEETVNKGKRQPGAAPSIDRVVDKVALVPFSKGEQILLNKLVFAGQETSLSMKVPPGKRAITIPVDNIASVGGMLRPGDHVDVVGLVPIQGMSAEGKIVTQMTTMPLFQDVLVLAVGQEFASISTRSARRTEKEERATSSIITLALSPQEANLIAFVQEQGKVRLILRSLEDTQVLRFEPASWDLLFRTVRPDVAQQPEPAKVEVKNKVEIWRGTQREVKELK